MARKKRNTNILILQNEIQNLVIKEEKEKDEPKELMKGSGVDLPVIQKLKKKGIPKDELINTKRLLTM